MAEPLKTFFSPALVRRLAADIARVQPGLRSAAFIKQATEGLDELELLDRGRHIAHALSQHRRKKKPPNRHRRKKKPPNSPSARGVVEARRAAKRRGTAGSVP